MSDFSDSLEMERDTVRILEKIQSRQKDPYEAPVTMAFLGDSVTQGCFDVYVTQEQKLQTTYDREQAYCTKLSGRLTMLYPRVPVHVINAGISGDCAPRAAGRLQRDVLAFAPDLTVVCFGLNDACLPDETETEYTDALDMIFSQLQCAGSEVIFMTPNMMNTRIHEKIRDPIILETAEMTMQIQNTGVLNRYLEKAKQLCKAHHIPVCDCYAGWMRWKEHGVDTTALLANYINHPLPEMHDFFADSLLEMLFHPDL